MVGFGSSLRMGRRTGWEQAYLDYETLKLLLSQIEAVYEEEAHGLSWEANREMALFGDINIGGQGTSHDGRKRKKVKDFRDELFAVSDTDEAFASTSEDEDQDNDDDNNNDTGNGEDSISKSSSPHVSADLSNKTINRIFSNTQDNMMYNHGHLQNRDYQANVGNFNSIHSHNTFLPPKQHSLDQPRFSLAYSHDFASSSSEDSFEVGGTDNTCGPWLGGPPKRKQRSQRRHWSKRNSNPRFNMPTTAVSMVSSSTGVVSGNSVRNTTSTGFIMDRYNMDSVDDDNAESPGYTSFDAHPQHLQRTFSQPRIPSASSMPFDAPSFDSVSEHSPLVTTTATNTNLLTQPNPFNSNLSESQSPNSQFYISLSKPPPELGVQGIQEHSSGAQNETYQSISPEFRRVNNNTLIRPATIMRSDEDLTGDLPFSQAGIREIAESDADDERLPPYQQKRTRKNRKHRSKQKESKKSDRQERQTKRRHRPPKRRKKRKRKRATAVPVYIRNAHARARGITERFLGLLRAEVEKVTLFTQARLGELADTAGSLRYLSFEDSKESPSFHATNAAQAYDNPFSSSRIRIHGSGSSSMDEDGTGNGHFSWSDSSSDDEKHSNSSARQMGASRSSNKRSNRRRAGLHDKQDSRTYKRAGSRRNVVGGGGIMRNSSYDLENEAVDATRKQIEYFEEQRQNRPIFQRHDHITGEDLLLVSAVDEADSFTAVGVELLHILRYICVNLVAVRKICRKHDRLLANRMLGGYYHRKSVSKIESQEDKTLGGLVSSAIDGIGEAESSTFSYQQQLGTQRTRKLVGVYDKKIQDLANSRTVEVVFSCVSMALSEYEVSMIRADALARLNPVSGRNAAVVGRAEEGMDSGSNNIPRRQQIFGDGLQGGQQINDVYGDIHNEINEHTRLYPDNSYMNNYGVNDAGARADINMDLDDEGESGSDDGDSSYAPSTASNAPITRLRFTVLSIASFREAARFKADPYGAFISRSLMSYTGQSVVGEGLDGCSCEALEFIVAYNPDAALLLHVDTLYSSLRVSRWTKEASIIAMMRSALAVGADLLAMDAVGVAHNRARSHHGGRKVGSGMGGLDDLDTYTYTQHSRFGGIEADVDSMGILPNCRFSSRTHSQSRSYSKPISTGTSSSLAYSYGFGYGTSAGFVSGYGAVDPTALLEAMAPIESTSSTTYRLSEESASPIWFRMNRFSYFLYTANYYAMHASANGFVRRLALPDSLSAIIIGATSVTALISAIMQSSMIDSYSSDSSARSRNKAGQVHANAIASLNRTEMGSSGPGPGDADHSRIEPYKRLLVIAAVLSMLGNGIYAYGVVSQSIVFIVFGRLLIGFGSCEVVHRQFAMKFVPRSLLVSESAHLVHSQLSGVVFGLLIGSLSELLIPPQIDVAGFVIFQFNVGSIFLCLVWFIHLMGLIFVFRSPPNNKGPSRHRDYREARDHDVEHTAYKKGADYDDGSASPDDDEMQSSDSESTAEPVSLLHRQSTEPDLSGIDKAGWDEHSAAGDTTNAFIANIRDDSETGSVQKSQNDAQARANRKREKRSHRSGTSQHDTKRKRRFQTTMSRIGKILRLNMAVSVSAGIIFFVSYCQEVLFTSCALITSRYFDWPGFLVGFFLAALFVLAVPTEIVSERMSQRYAERRILKRALLILTLGLLAMINWGSLFALATNVRDLFTVSKDIRQHHYDWMLGQVQYVIGVMITFVAILSLETASRSLLSKTCPSTHHKSVMTSIGTVVTFLCLVGRIVADMHILTVGLSHRLINADIVNALVMPMLCSCLIALHLVRKHYFFLL